jgi:hypothetical protein
VLFPFVDNLEMAGYKRDAVAGWIKS